MAKLFKIFLTALVLILGYIVVAPYQYGMSTTLFYTVSIGCIVFSAVLVFLLLKKATAKEIVSIVVLILLIIFSTYEIYDQQPNIRIKQKIAEFLPNAPIEIAGFRRLEPATIAAQPYYLNEDYPKNELSDVQWSRTVFLKRAISPEKSVDYYAIRFKRPYMINGNDVSKKACSNLMCSYYFTGSIILDPIAGELLGLWIENKGVGK
ncbi:hypothetical protein [Paenibacillus sedimenti]|uniref:Uncharacterized protein n=1 Tax=Paenibacillus sedimenti TaxID=2770274 RepID=A0A926KV42_9BACL|nr:hypothetical protein [Paenibacillus sedimenti]MBD0383731.1 hypothetical protein [Paenibacillus sedimenti]